MLSVQVPPMRMFSAPVLAAASTYKFSKRAFVLDGRLGKEVVTVHRIPAGVSHVNLILGKDPSGSRIVRERGAPQDFEKNDITEPAL